MYGMCHFYEAFFRRKINCRVSISVLLRSQVAIDFEVTFWKPTFYGSIWYSFVFCFTIFRVSILNCPYNFWVWFAEYWYILKIDFIKWHNPLILPIEVMTLYLAITVVGIGINGRACVTWLALVRHRGLALLSEGSWLWPWYLRLWYVYSCQWTKDFSVSF